MAISNSYVKLPEGNSRAWRLRYSHRSSDIFLNVFFGIDTQIPKHFAPRSCFWCCAWICPSPHMFPWISWGSTVDGPGFWIDEGTGKNRNGGLKVVRTPCSSMVQLWDLILLRALFILTSRRAPSTWNDWALDNCSPHQACQTRRPTSFHSKPQWNSCLPRCITEESTIAWSFIHVYYQCLFIYIYSNIVYVCVSIYIYTHFLYIYMCVCPYIYIYISIHFMSICVYIIYIYIHIYRRLSLRVSRICLCRPQCRDALHFARGTPMFMYIYIYTHTHTHTLVSLSLSSTYYMSIAFPNELMSQDKHTGSPSIQLTGEMGPSYTLYGEKKHSKATGQQMPIIEFDIAWYYTPISSIYLARIIGIGTSRFAADMKVHGFSFSQKISYRCPPGCSVKRLGSAAALFGCGKGSGAAATGMWLQILASESADHIWPSDHGWHFLLENVRFFSSWNHVFICFHGLKSNMLTCMLILSRLLSGYLFGVLGRRNLKMDKTVQDGVWWVWTSLKHHGFLKAISTPFRGSHYQGLVNVLFWGFWTSLSSISWWWNIPNSWVMWKIRTFTNPCHCGFHGTAIWNCSCHSCWVLGIICTVSRFRIRTPSSLGAIVAVADENQSCSFTFVNSPCCSAMHLYDPIWSYMYVYLCIWIKKY